MTDYATFLQDVFSDFGTIHCRRMFGGLGVFKDGLMFGLVADDTLYLKGDDQTAPYFAEKNLEKFGYMKGDKEVKLSYFEAPEELFDDPGEAVKWGKRALDAALRAKKKKPKKKAKK